MSQDIKVGIIYGSTREGRFCDTVAEWLIEAAGRHDGFELVTIDPAIEGVNDQGLGQRLDTADAFIVVTPEYNHSFPGPLKSLIDSFYTEWQAKPVGFVSYGGISGGLRAVEQLRGCLPNYTPLAFAIRSVSPMSGTSLTKKVRCARANGRNGHLKPCSPGCPGGPGHCVKPGLTILTGR